MSPRVFNIPASAPFLRVLIDALRAGKLVPGFPAHRDPLELARATLYLPTRRACRLARKVFFDIGADAVILPHIVALGELDEDELIFAQAATGELAETALRLPDALAPFERRLLLAQLIMTWVKSPELHGAAGTPLVASAPMVTMRLTGLKGQSVEDLLKREGNGLPAWLLRREYRSTYRDTLSDTERVTAGRFVGQVRPGLARVPVSVEESLVKDLQLKLGDELTFDVQGVPVVTYVASVRQVEWQRMQPNFYVVFPTGVLEPAPKTFIAAVRAEPAASARLQQAVGRELPSVAAIDLSLLIKTLDGIFSKAAFAISFMAAFTVATGVIVLVGAILTGRVQRLRETVLLRTLGAKPSSIMSIFVVQGALLGFIGLLIGVVGGVALVVGALLARR